MEISHKRRTRVGLLFAGVIAMAGTLAIAAPKPAAAPKAATAKAMSSDWQQWGPDGSEQHYSPLDQVNLRTVGRLGVAWQYQLPAENSATQPVEADGRLYVLAGHAQLRAFEAATGKLLWTFDQNAQVREHAGRMLRIGWGAKGLAYWNHRLFIGLQDGRVMSIDANSGKELWEVTEVENGEIRNINGPPRVYGGKLFVGHGGGDVTRIRGYTTAYDAMTGKRLWRFYTTPKPEGPQDNPALEMAAKTWLGNRYGGGGGGAVWNAFSYDPKLNLIYFGAGNGYPDNQLIRSSGGGDNLFIASVIAVHADTGEYAWHFQICPGDQWDCDDETDLTLATLPIDGKPRRVILHAPKNGYFYVLDAKTGQFISGRQYVDKLTWAYGLDPKTGRPNENPGIRYHGKELFELWPGVRGAHSWQPQSFSPRTGLVYVPVIEAASIIGDKGVDLSNPDQVGTTGNSDPDLPGSRTSFLKAWDPVAQKERWRVPQAGDWPGGTMATAGDLVFEGRIDGKLVAYDARSGKAVWTYRTDAPILAAPITYAVGGRQYISIVTGNGATGGGLFSGGLQKYRTDYHMPRRVLTFALDAKTRVPAAAPPPPLIAPADPDYRSDPELEKKGATLFARSGCVVCHGFNAVPGGSAPDLRISPYPASREGFAAILHDGALLDAGMPQYPELSPDTIEAIRQYLRARGQTMPGGKAAGSKGPAGPSDLRG